MADQGHELLAFALDLYRAPLKNLRFVAVSRPLPAGLDALLEALNKRSDTEFWTAKGRQLEASPDEIRSAGFFLVKRLLFADGANFYRILGLDPDSDIARIREHYRLLMALFHPDRIHQRDEWTEQYAPRINEAYSTLKHPDRKQAYDRTLELHEDPWGDEVPPPGGGSGMVESEPWGSSEFETLDLVRNVESEFRGGPKNQRVIGVSMVVLLAAVVGLGILLRRDIGPIVTAGSAVDVGSERPLTALATLHQPHTDLHTDQTALGTEPITPAAVEITISSVSEHIGPVSPEPAALNGLAVTVTLPEADAQAREESANTDVDAGLASSISNSTAIDIPETPAVRQEPVQQVSTKTPRVGGENYRAVATPPRTYPTSAVGDTSKATTELNGGNVVSRPGKATAQAVRRGFINQRDIDLLISRFIHAYEAGDTEKFMSLFSYRVKTNNAVGRGAIARQYGQFFRTTDHRSLIVKDLDWVPKGVNTARISFFAAIEVGPNGSSAGDGYEGGVDLYVRMDEQRLTILEFFHQLGKR